MHVLKKDYFHTYTKKDEFLFLTEMSIEGM